MSDMGQAVPRWGVVQIMSKRARWIQRDIAAHERDTFQPTFKRRWFVDGKESEKQCALMPGYMFFELNQDGWGPVAEVEGVLRVLGGAMPVGEQEFNRLWLGSKMGEWNDIEASISVPSERRRRRRRPRPSKRARAQMRAERQL